MMSIRSVLYATICLFVLGGGASRTSLAASSEEREVRPARERLIEYWLIGGTDRNPSRRDVGRHQVSDAGWPAFVSDRVKPAYDWGLRRFWLHNPFGTIGGEQMKFAQYLEARESGQTFLTKDFAKSWKPVVDGQWGQPTELICYLGAADFEDGERLEELQKAGNTSQTMAFMLRAIQPLLRAGASIGADAATRHSDDGPTFHFYKYLEGIGMPAYIESRPKKEFPGWGDFPVVAEDRWWKRSDPKTHADAAWAMSGEELDTPVVRLMVDYMGGSTDPEVIEPLIARIREALLEGHTVAFRSDGLRSAGIPLSRLTDGIDEAMGVDEARTEENVEEEAAGGSKPVVTPRDAPQSRIRIRKSNTPLRIERSRIRR